MRPPFVFACTNFYHITTTFCAVAAAGLWPDSRNNGPMPFVRALVRAATQSWTRRTDRPSVRKVTFSSTKPHSK